MDSLSVTKTKRSESGGIVFILLLILSFFWINIYPTFGSVIYSFELGYGNVLNTASGNLSYLIFSTLLQGIIAWLAFEIVFWIYREVLSFKIYSFVMPLQKFKIESRLFYFYRNILVGIFINLSFFFPYLYIFSPLFSIIITLAMILIYAKHIKNKYSESIIGHFVFKTYIVPLFVFEIISVFIQVWGILA